MVKAIFTILQSEIKKYNDSSKMSAKDIDEYNKDIDKKIAEFINGNFYTHEEVI